MSKLFDFAIVGLGAMGSAVAAQLARSGYSVIAFDKLNPPHNFGSSHGESRIIREAYYEGAAYVPLASRALHLWRELEIRLGARLLERVGALTVGKEHSHLIYGTLHSAKAHHIPYEILSRSEVMCRFQGLSPAEGVIAVFEPGGGLLRPERCVAAMLKDARSHGAQLSANDLVLAVTERHGIVHISASSGQYEASKAVVANGAWVTKLPGMEGLPLEVERQVVHWFDVRADVPRPAFERLPVYLFEYEEGRLFYGFPDLGTGVKVAVHQQGMIVDPDKLDRSVKESDLQKICKLTERYLPTLASQPSRSSVCMYTNTMDENFIIDWIRGGSQILLVSACSGHGFKFSIAIGELVEDLLVGRQARLSMDIFKLPCV